MERVYFALDSRNYGWHAYMRREELLPKRVTLRVHVQMVTIVKLVPRKTIISEHGREDIYIG